MRWSGREGHTRVARLEGDMPVSIAVITSLSLVLWILVLIALKNNYEKEPKLRPSRGASLPEGPPLVSVVLPARNEEEMIGACIEAVLAQDYPLLELIVVDDRSEDRTSEIVEHYVGSDDRVHLVKGKPLPPEWAGKCHAIYQGVEEARGEWLLMLDADTFLKPECLSAAVQDAVLQKADLYTVIFETQCESFWEKLVQPLFLQFIFMALPLHRLNDPASREAAAPGPFLLFRRQAYEAIGGHAAMRDETVEDLRLAQRIKETGHRLYGANAVPFVTCRRRIGLKEIWHGWSRVFYSGVDNNILIAMAALAGMGLFLLLPWVTAPYALVTMALGKFSPGMVALLLLGLAHCLVFVAIRRLLHLFYRMDWSLAWLQPLAVLIAMAIMVNSILVAGRSRSVVWRGRQY